MISEIGVRDLKANATRIIKQVRETQGEYVVTVHGKPVAVIRPVLAEDEERLRLARIEAHLARLDELAQAIGEAWNSPLTIRETLEEQREGRWQSLMPAST